MEINSNTNNPSSPIIEKEMQIEATHLGEKEILNMDGVVTKAMILEFEVLEPPE